MDRRKAHSLPQSFPRREKGKKAKKESLVHNLSKSGQVEPQIAFFR